MVWVSLRPWPLLAGAVRAGEDPDPDIAASTLVLPACVREPFLEALDELVELHQDGHEQGG